MVAAGVVQAVSVSTEKGSRKTAVPQACLIENWGIEGDAHAGEWHRQISLLAAESIETMRAKGLDIHPGDFAENLVISGFDLSSLRIGDRILAGSCELEITQIGKECHAHCAIYAQTGDCVMPREGIFARVISGGILRPGDPVTRCE